MYLRGSRALGPGMDGLSLTALLRRHASVALDDLA